MKFDKNNALDMMTFETYKDIVDPNYRAALNELDNITHGVYVADDESNPYDDVEKSFMAELAHKLENMIWVLVTVGNKAYADINDVSVEFERWFNIAHTILMREVMQILGRASGVMDVLACTTKSSTKYERMNKEFNRTRLSHPLFSKIEFGSRPMDDKAAENMEAIHRVFNDPLFIDHKKVLPILEDLINKLEVDPALINTVDLQSIMCDENNRRECELTTDPDIVDMAVMDMNFLVENRAKQIVSYVDKFDLAGKLNVLAFLNQLIFQTSTYSRHLIRDGIEYDHDKSLNPLIKRIAELRQHLGIKVDDGGNYIGEDTNKLI